MPNGGFQALPESLVTKQLASLLQSTDFATVAPTSRFPVYDDVEDEVGKPGKFDALC